MESLHTNLTVFFQWLLRTTLQGSLLTCVILLIKMALRERLPARWHYCLWLVLLVRLSLPWAPQSRLSLYGLIPRSLPSYRASTFPAVDARSDAAGGKARAPGQEAGTGLAPAATQAQAPPPDQGGPPTSASAANNSRPSNDSPGTGNGSFVEPMAGASPWLWLGGCLVLGGYVFARAFGLWWMVRSERPVTDQQILDLLEDCKMQMRVRTLVGVVVTDKTRSPALFGFVRPRILLPDGLLGTLDLDELHYVFLHELAHLRRRDIYLAWLICLLQILHWFNPLMWLAFRRMRADQEVAADALVLTTAGVEESHLYGQTILSLIGRFARPQYLPSLAGILENPSHIERRMTMITRFKNNSYRWSPLAVALVVALSCASLPNARSGKAPQPAGASTSAEQPTAPVAGDSSVFVDPNTGIRFTKFKTLSGPSDVIQSAWSVNLSPNGEFLLDGVRVVPLDGRTPFDLVDMPGVGGQGSLSPDGRKVVFFCGEALWLIEVNPDTGRAAGSPRKLLDRQIYVTDGWSRDSQRILLLRKDGQPGDAAVWSWWTLGLDGGAPSPLADPFSFGLLSPDGKTVAYEARASANSYSRSSSLLVRPAAGGEAREILDDATPLFPVAWSGDNTWLVSGAGRRLDFIRISDRHEVKVPVPWGLVSRQYPLRGKLLFYQSSYEDKTALKVVSVAGGPPMEFGWPNLTFLDESWSTFPSWAGDSHSILVAGQRGEDKWGLWAVPLDRRAPRPLMIDTPMWRDAYARLFSPDNSKLLFCTGRGAGPWDVWAVPISLAQMRSTGPAVKVFGGMVPPVRSPEAFLDSWSPDARKIAVVHNWDIWVVDADGKNTLQLTKTPEMEGWPMWSADGKMIAFFTQPSDLTQVGTQEGHLRVHVVPVSGGEAKVIADLKHVPIGGGAQRYVWHPDGKVVTVACEEDGIIANFAIAGGERRTVVRLKDVGMERASRLRWSPDGRFLAFEGGTNGSDMKLYVYQPDTAKLQRLTDGGVAPFYWSPDSKWISYFSGQTVKTRPESVLWEMDVEEAVTKLAK